MRNVVPALKRRAILKCPCGTGCGVSDAAGKKSSEKQENDDCRQNLVQPVPDPNYTVPADEQKSPLNDPVELARPAGSVRVLQLHLAADHAAGGVAQVKPLHEVGGPMEGEPILVRIG